MTASFDYYRILGVEPSATRKEIKEAFKTKSLYYHPDKSTDTDATQKMQQLIEAYKVLTDTKQREAYDQRQRYEANLETNPPDFEIPFGTKPFAEEEIDGEVFQFYAFYVKTSTAPKYRRQKRKNGKRKHRDYRYDYFDDETVGEFIIYVKKVEKEPSWNWYWVAFGFVVLFLFWKFFWIMLSLVVAFVALVYCLGGRDETSPQ